MKRSSFIEIFKRLNSHQFLVDTLPALKAERIKKYSAGFFSLFAPPYSLRVFVTLMALFCAGNVAAMKVTRDVPYGINETWSAAIRYLRADRGYKINDKDRENGYIIYVFPGSGAIKKCPASLEIYETTPATSSATPKVKIALDIEHQPSYIATGEIERILKKIREEQGPPRIRTQKKKPKPEVKQDLKNRDSNNTKDNATTLKDDSSQPIRLDNTSF